MGFFTRFSTANLDMDCWLVLDILYHSYDYARRMTVSDQENRSVSALGSRVDDTSSEVKLCDRVSDQIGIAYGWYVYIVRIWMKMILKRVIKFEYFILSKQSKISLFYKMKLPLLNLLPREKGFWKCLKYKRSFIQVWNDPKF